MAVGGKLRLSCDGRCSQEQLRLVGAAQRQNPDVMITFRKGQHLSIGRPGIGRVAVVAHCQPLLRTAAVGWPPVQIPDPCFVAPIDYAPSIWCPERVDVAALLRSDLSQRTSREIVNPKRVCTRRDADGYMLPIGRQGS